jgi:N-acyl-D-amino-acid deacylase
VNNHFDILLKEGTIINGTGITSFVADIGIINGKIQKIGKITGSADIIIDASGLSVSPGFIDIHNHIDHAILAFPNAESYIKQGVTTSLVGNCGLSMAPINPDYLDLTRDYLTPFLRTDFNYKWDWKTTKEYSEKIKKNGTSLNLAFLVGQGTLRIAVKGFETSTASKKEIQVMKNILSKELKEGAFGLSTGLVYPPGSYTTTEELIDLTSVLRDYSALYATHMRSESDKLIESVEEAIRIGEVNDISVEISHHKAIGKVNWGKVNTTLKMLANARKRGVDINCDVYPYTAAMTTVSSLLPPWTLEGGVKEMLERLEKTSFREKIKKDIIEGKMKGENWIKSIGWENIVVGECPLDRKSEGKSLQIILEEINEFNEPFKGFFDWLAKIKGEATMVFFCMDEKDIKTVIANPLSMIISDSWVISPIGGGKPHPRAYGSFPRVLGKYVRVEKVLTLEDAIKKMTSLPAKKIGLKDRGIIKEGFWADLVIFDPEKVKDMATFENPHQYPKGIYEVVVNGQLVVHKGDITGIKPGKILKR